VNIYNSVYILKLHKFLKFCERKTREEGKKLTCFFIIQFVTVLMKELPKYYLF
jgi:hypothetical protein